MEMNLATGMALAAALLAAAAVVLLAVLLAKINKTGGDAGQLRDHIKNLGRDLAAAQKNTADEFERNRREMGQNQRDMRVETAGSLEKMVEQLSLMERAINATLRGILETNAQQNERMTARMAQSLADMQQSNEKKLNEMRQTVDEKLTSTLSARLDSSFKTVSDQLENVNKSIGEMQSLSSGITTNVTSLSRILTNVKARGTWAEVQLDSLLAQTIPGLYERNYAADGTRERVEFAIRIPTGDEARKITYLPVDSKFPMEDYIRLMDAADRADDMQLTDAKKALERRILSEAGKIQKYINEPDTTPYAIMYLATEGLYTEVVNSATGLCEKVQTQYNVMIAGPTTITALLNTLSMGFRAVTINEKANEVRELLAAAKVQYDKFGDVLEKARKKIEEAGNTLDEARSRNRIIQKKLRTVAEIDVQRADTLLELTAAEIDESIEDSLEEALEQTELA